LLLTEALGKQLPPIKTSQDISEPVTKVSPSVVTVITDGEGTSRGILAAVQVPESTNITQLLEGIELGEEEDSYVRSFARAQLRNVVDALRKRHLVLE
jgi:hypothetical protein